MTTYESSANLDKPDDSRSAGLSVMKWMDNLAEEHYVALASFQSRFYARQPQLLPIFDRFVDLMLSLCTSLRVAGQGILG